MTKELQLPVLWPTVLIGHLELGSCSFLQSGAQGTACNKVCATTVLKG